MMRRATARALPWVMFGVAVGTLLPTHVLGQSSSFGSTSATEVWPRWQEAAAPTPPPSPPTPGPAGDGEVLALSIVGGMGGWAGGVLAGVALCSNGCGNDEWDALAVVALMGAGGAGLGSTLLGCGAARERGCAARTLPVALLGSVAGVAGAVAVASTTGSGLASWAAFSLIQGLVTAGRIR